MFLWPDLYHPLLHGGGRSGQMVGAVDSRLRGPGLIPPGDIVLCCWARHFTITMLISPRHGYQQIMVGITLWCSSKGGGGGSRYIPSQLNSTETKMSSALMGHLVWRLSLGSISKDVFEQLTSTRSESYSILMPWCYQNYCICYMSLLSERRSARTFFQNHSPRLQKAHFQLTCIAQKYRCLNSLLSFTLLHCMNVV